MKNIDKIMNNPILKKLWMDYVSENRESFKVAVDSYDKAWYNIRNKLAETGTELTPDQLKELTEFIRETLNILDGNPEE